MSDISSTTAPLTSNDEALLILEYLETEELSKTFLSFLQESRHLKDLQKKLYQRYYQQQHLSKYPQVLSIDDDNFQAFFNKSLTLYSDTSISLDNSLEQQRRKLLPRLTCERSCQTVQCKGILDDSEQPNFLRPISLNSLACSFSPPPSPFINCQKNDNIEKEINDRKRKEIVDLTTTEINENINIKKQKESPIEQIDGPKDHNKSLAGLSSPCTVIKEQDNQDQSSYKLSLTTATKSISSPSLIESSTLKYQCRQSESFSSNCEHYSYRQRSDSTEIACLHTPQSVHYEVYDDSLISMSNIAYDPLYMNMEDENWNTKTTTIITELKKDPLTGKYTLPERIIETPINHSNKIISDILLSTSQYRNIKDDNQLQQTTDNNNEYVQNPSSTPTFSQLISLNRQQEDTDYSASLSEVSIDDLLNSSANDNDLSKIRQDDNPTSAISLDDLLAMPQSLQTSETNHLLSLVSTVYSRAHLQPMELQQEEQQLIQLQFIQTPMSSPPLTKVIIVSHDLLQSIISTQQIPSTSTSFILHSTATRKRKSRSKTGKENKTLKKNQNIVPRTS
ncbi:unnamed protein product [Didymodactylos carnosus]|uniref:Uncharacterized protein n=1 Tax=Didymodactylos carnosus TaxID=1234261 RepID=A0A8S2NRY5_9BILA|nr:unnamed protein product [Didymodactylos carnosus]CAF4014671.1 unnamed protein product [Didymodactylos carnosus]